MTKALGVMALVCSLLLGALQEKIKININSNLEFSRTISDYDQMTPGLREAAIEERISQTPYNYYYSHDKAKWLFKFDATELYVLKWVFTLILIGAHLLLGLLILNFLLNFKKQHLKYYIGIYLVGFVLAIVSFGAGKLLQLDFYPFSRRIVGFLQSIIPVVFVFFISKISPNVIQSTTS